MQIGLPDRALFERRPGAARAPPKRRSGKTQLSGAGSERSQTPDAVRFVCPSQARPELIVFSGAAEAAQSPPEMAEKRVNKVLAASP